MKVLMTADTVGGVWVYALDLVRELAAYGCEVTLATMGGPLQPAARQAALAVPGVTLHESSYRLEWMEDPWEEVDAAGDWLLGIARRVKPDVVHLNNYAHGALPWRAPVLMVGHSCVLSWWQAVYRQPAPAAWATYAQRVRDGLQAAHLVAAPTQAMLDALALHYGPLRGTQVIVNGRSPAGFAPAAKEPFVLAVGRLWDEAKNVRALDEVAPDLTWPAVVAGQATHPSGGVRHFRHVQTLGQVNNADLAHWMGRAAIYALPARYEPFGLSVLEAALSGCALVLGDIPSLREVWGEAALYAPPDDSQALAAAINRLAADDVLRTRMAQAAQRRAGFYTAFAMGARYWLAYQRLAGAYVQRPARRQATQRSAPALWPQPAVFQPSTNLG